MVIPSSQPPLLPDWSTSLIRKLTSVTSSSKPDPSTAEKSIRSVAVSPAVPPPRSSTEELPSNGSPVPTYWPVVVSTLALWPLPSSV